MSTHIALTRSITEVGRAIRRPEELAIRWRDRLNDAEHSPHALIFFVLLVNAVAGTAVYGLVMHMHRGPEGMLEGALLMPLAAGIAWTITLPALYIINSVFGSRLDFTSTALAATITVSFGAAAMLAGVPITWFFSLALPFDIFRWLTHIIVFAGVGFCMSDVFLRVMRALEPNRTNPYPLVWLALLTFVGAEFFWLLGVFDF
ncbi:MAG: hypothetical protein ACNA8W_14005 [Bradymonadaceae bacterium]